MAGKYAIYNAHTRQYLKSYQQPDRKFDVYITQWTQEARGAMRFEGCKTARGVAARLGEEMKVENMGNA